MYKTRWEAVGKPALKKLMVSQKPFDLEISDKSKHMILISGKRIKVVAPCPWLLKIQEQFPNFWLQVPDSFSSISTQIEMQWDYLNDPHCVQYLN